MLVNSRHCPLMKKEYNGYWGVATESYMKIFGGVHMLGLN